MKYFVNNIETYKRLIEDNDNFFCKEITDKNYGILGYRVSGENTFPKFCDDDNLRIRLDKTLLRNIRGIKYRLSDGLILGLPHWKFFNLGEREECLADKIDFDRNHCIVQKLDGSMVHSIVVDGNILYMTKNGESDVSKLAYDTVVRNNPNYDKLGYEMAKIDHTPIYEFVSPIAKIVVDYNKHDMILTEIRNNFTGDILPKKALFNIGKEYDIPVVKFYDTKVSDITNVIGEVSNLENDEGIIIRFDGQEKYKVKSKWYVDRHRVFSNVVSEKFVLISMMEETLDDLKPLMSEKVLNDISRYENDVNSYILNRMSEIQEFCLDCYQKNISKKEFSEMINNNLKPYDSNIYFSFYNSLIQTNDASISYENSFNNLKKYIIKLAQNNTRLTNGRDFIGNIKMSDYFTSAFNFEGE